MSARSFTTIMLVLALPVYGTESGRDADNGKHAGASESREEGLESAVARTPMEPTRGPAGPEPTPKPIVHDGETFDLANSIATKSVQTDEYTIAGEKLGQWSQLITVQRLTLEQPAAVDAFVDYFRTRIVEDGATLDVLSGTKAAAVFAVRFPKSDRNDEQVMICLAFVDPVDPEVLNLVQYAIKPTKCPVDITAARIKSWRDRFLAQAHTFEPVSS